MVDCGEGAQLSMRRAGVKFTRLHHIFISHLHGDHILGLPGLLSSLMLIDYTGEMHVYMLPEGIDVIKRVLDTFAHTPTYTLVFHPISTGKHVIYEDDSLTVETFSLCHLVPAVGFIFREKPKKRHLKGDMVEFHQVPIRLRESLKLGADFVKEDGTVIPNRALTTDPNPSRSYAYCSDTMYNPGVVQAVSGVDTLFHEATYGDDKADKAAMRGHSTARDAGKAAAEAKVGKLVIGHFSKSYNGMERMLLEQAKEEFDNTLLANEGLEFEV